MARTSDGSGSGPLLAAYSEIDDAVMQVRETYMMSWVVQLVGEGRSAYMKHHGSISGWRESRATDDGLRSGWSLKDVE